MLNPLFAVSCLNCCLLDLVSVSWCHHKPEKGVRALWNCFLELSDKVKVVFLQS